MLGWAAVFLMIALIAALFGFGGLAAASAGIAKLIFFVFIALFAVALVMEALRRLGTRRAGQGPSRSSSAPYR
jgi:uncharacterized membrane protein YtjA (UPF0391 family)